MMRINKICGILNLTESRLATNPLTLFRPVAALPFACRYRLIDFPLTNLSTAGVETVGVFLKDNSLRSVYDHVRSGREWGLDSVHGGLFFFSAPSEDRGTGLGTEGDIYNYFKNIEFIEKSEADYTVVMGTRMLCNVDVKAVLRSHIEQGADITVVYKSVDHLSKDDQQISCMTIGDDGLVRGLKSCSLQMKENKALVNMEIYLMKSTLLIRLIRNAVAENEHCNLNDVLHRAIIKLPTNGFEYTGYLKSINSVKSYYDANIDMLQEANMTALLKGNQNIHTKVKNEAPTFYARTSHVSDSLVANGCMMKGEVAHSVIFRNVTIEQKAVVDSSIILQGSYIGSNAELRYVVLDKQVRIEPNTKLIGTKDKPIVIEKNSVISRISEEGEQVLKGVSHFHGNELEV
ncbi:MULTISPECIES: glucose-1-phosphate adenylyltransferase subunit GlgD [unclassified Sporolactobacillus]|uniref:glucose-1-phosphate adenylyltransferase subunit GlgD n=1 Tax=unclassified Sporolactobacillus TaxID=2628533 RepID=UPI002368BFB5|nr:glucose-1-phosphate adenylyltransferase subunit GlgD [Sporolactobacillus sp. CQH2019]MDD9148681.1 glucose-1-phosphate adenylyltransferase subunit GlgD [Sporolactobacillus sp. CQH2019]